MKIKEAISNLLFQWLRKSNQGSISERHAEAIINTRDFLKLTLQDKILCLGKLIKHFGSNEGCYPNSMERTLVALNKELNYKIDTSWAGIYSEGFQTKTKNDKISFKTILSPN